MGVKESVQLISTCELSDFSDLRKHTSCEFGDQAACGWCDYAFIRAGFGVHKENELKKKRSSVSGLKGGGYPRVVDSSKYAAPIVADSILDLDPVWVAK